MEALKEFFNDVEVAFKETSKDIGNKEHFEYVYNHIKSLIRYPVDPETKKKITKIHSLFKTVVDNFPRISDKNFIMALLITKFFVEQYKKEKKEIISQAFGQFLLLTVPSILLAHIVLFIPTDFKLKIQDVVFTQIPSLLWTKFIEFKNLIFQKFYFLYSNLLAHQIDKQFFIELGILLIILAVVYFLISLLLGFLLRDFYIKLLFFGYIFLILKFMASRNFSFIIISYCVIVFGILIGFDVVNALRNEKIKILVVVYEYIKSFL
ncbi:hypothetical protein [Desulfurobacterium atlanticum]|uniref:Uncharacterized protein n=1 Tax=Desulfurobacterium atlanticum TaxID=240169 RepID=A0A239A6J5_9BACT|nr:hypothetical protein [Desulfurobacterium atlanticum]SNR90684.1 hypothetical protein SAMN06265340_11530 [Desulfurobacterium atlanticum]